MADKVETTEESPIVHRISGQDIGNPMPPTIITAPHEGHKADADSWLRTRDRRYLKKQARQRITAGSTDKSLYQILVSRRSD